MKYIYIQIKDYRLVFIWIDARLYSTFARPRGNPGSPVYTYPNITPVSIWRKQSVRIDDS